MIYKGDKMNFYIIIVVYNQFVENSPIIKELFKCTSLYLYCADNSTKTEIIQKNTKFCKEKSINYFCMDGNVGLSSAYNHVIQQIPKDLNNYIIICDQDTEVNNTIIEKYKKAIFSNPKKMIFCPIIKDNKGIMSPAKFTGRRYVHSRYDDFNKKIGNYSFINSCMCVNSIIFEKLKYDENLFLDCVDYDFVNTIRQYFTDEIFFVIEDYEIFQNFSGVTKNAFESDYTRFKIYLKDFRYFYKKWYRKSFYSEKILLARAIKLSLIHRNFSFMKIYFTK